MPSDGIDLQSANGSTIEGNLIGTDRDRNDRAWETTASGWHPAGSSGVTPWAGPPLGKATSSPSTAAHSRALASSSIRCPPPTGNTHPRKLHPRQHADPGIDVNVTTASTANDLCDGDTGANNLQNFPVISSVSSYGASSTTVAPGLLNSTANTTFDLDFYS